LEKDCRVFSSGEDKILWFGFWQRSGSMNSAAFLKSTAVRYTLLDGKCIANSRKFSVFFQKAQQQLQNSLSSTSLITALRKPDKCEGEKQPM